MSDGRVATFSGLIDEGVLEIGDGYRAKNDELGGDGPIFLRAGLVQDDGIDLSKAERFLAARVPAVAGKLSQPGDVLVTTKGNSTGRTAFVGTSFPTVVYSPHLSYWRSRRVDVLAPGFLRYWSQSEGFRRQLAGMAASTDMAPYLSLTDQRRLRIEVPPIEVQRRAARILGALDDKIELNRRMSQTLEAAARALFTSWFVDFDAAQTSVAQLVESEVGPVPAGWCVVPLSGVLTELETGGRPRGGVAGYESGIPSIGAESIVGIGVFDYSKTKYIPQDFYSGMTKGRVRTRDVLLYKDGGRPGEYRPHLTLVGDGFPFDKCAINEHVYRLRVGPGLGQNYLYYWLSSDRAMAEMAVKGTGVAIPGLNSTQVRSLAILVPPADVTRAYDAIVEPLTARILANSQQSRSLALLRDALLPRLISGELRVGDAERAIEADTT